MARGALAEDGVQRSRHHPLGRRFGLAGIPQSEQDGQVVRLEAGGVAVLQEADRGEVRVLLRLVERGIDPDDAEAEADIADGDELVVGEASGLDAPAFDARAVGGAEVDEGPMAVALADAGMEAGSVPVIEADAAIPVATDSRFSAIGKVEDGGIGGTSFKDETCRHQKRPPQARGWG